MNCDLHIPDDKLKSLLRDCIDFRAKFLETLQDPDVRRELTGVVMDQPVEQRTEQPAIRVGQTVEIVGESQYGCSACIGHKGKVIQLDDDGEIAVTPIAGGKHPCGHTDHMFLPSSLRLLRTAEEVVKWAGGAK